MCVCVCVCVVAAAAAVYCAESTVEMVLTIKAVEHSRNTVDKASNLKQPVKYLLKKELFSNCF